MIAPKFIPRHPSQGYKEDRRYVLKRFLYKLGIDAAKATEIEQLLRALSASHNSFGKPDNIVMSYDSFNELSKLGKK